MNLRDFSDSNFSSPPPPPDPGVTLTHPSEEQIMATRSDLDLNDDVKVNPTISSTDIDFGFGNDEVEVGEGLESEHNKEVKEESHDEDKPAKSCAKPPKRKRDGSQLRKAPQAPKRFKSSYICFFMAKQQEIKDSLGSGATVTDVSKRSAEMWRTLPANERAYWDDVATKDKHRYMQEKASYTGPWQVPWKRAKKDPSAPKRPMSAFLYFSQERRRIIKEKNPTMRNTDISRVLGEMWRNATDEERNPHIEHEAKEREKYKVAIAKWREEHEAKLEAQRKAQEEQAANAAAYMNMNQPLYHDDLSYQHQQTQYPQQAQMPYYDPNMNYSGMQSQYMSPSSPMPYTNYMGMATNQSNPTTQSSYSQQPMYPTYNQSQSSPISSSNKNTGMSSSIMPLQPQSLVNTQYSEESPRLAPTQHMNYQHSQNLYDPNAYSQSYYHDTM